MKKREVTLHAPHGIHLRVAGQIVKVAQAHACSLSLSCDGCKHADACSIMQLLSLGAAQGSKIEVVADGPDAEIAMDKLSCILSDGGGI